MGGGSLHTMYEELILHPSEKRSLQLLKKNTMNGYLIFVLAVLILSWLLDLALEMLNLRSLTRDLPAEDRQGAH